jgi:hypothetical protein
MTQQRETSQPRTWATTVSDLLDCNKRVLMHWLEGTQAFSDEVSGLAQARMQLATEAWSALLACRSPEEVEQQRRFMAKAMERCAEELTSFSQLALRTASGEPPK